MIIYGKDETKFTNNGYGFLTDVINAYVEEELNGDYSLTLEYVLTGKNNEYLVEDNIIKCKVADGTEQLFTITHVSKTYDSFVITAKHIFYQLYYNLLEDVYPKNLSARSFLQWILTHTQYETQFIGTSNINASASARYVRKNPIEAILGAENSMVNLFGGELKRDNFNISLLDSIGRDNGVKCQFAKNITGIDISVDMSETVTRIMPIGFDGLMLPEKYVDSPLIDNYPFPRIGIFKFENIVYDPETEDAYHDIDEAYIALREEVRKLYKNDVDKPTVSINIDWLELSKTKEYEKYSALEKVGLGDIVHADILGIDFKTKVVKIKYNPLTDMIEQFEIGSIKPNINSSINSLRNTVEEINPTSILQQAKDSATNLITQAMGGYIYKTNNELFIMDTDDPQTAQRVWRWNINGLGYSSTGINGPYGLAMTMDGSIVADFITTGKLSTNLIEGYDSLVIQVAGNTRQYAILSQTLSELNSKIGDIADISTSAESDYAFIELARVNQSEPITITIHPTVENISYLYPNNGLYPSNDLYLKTRTIRFHNYTTNEDFDYVLPDDLLIFDENTYDEFFLDYDTHNCRITKRCAYNADGTVRKLDDEVIINYEYPTIQLTDGNYSVQLLGYGHGYLFTRLMAQNIYTSQFTTKAELNSAITQTAEEIDLSVNRKFQSYSTTTEMNTAIRLTADEINSTVSKKVGNDEIISKINQSAEQISINANKINLNGAVTANDNFKILTDGSIEAKGGKFTGDIVGGSLSIQSTTTNPRFEITSGRSNSNEFISMYSSGIIINQDKNYNGYQTFYGLDDSVSESQIGPTGRLFFKTRNASTGVYVRESDMTPRSINLSANNSSGQQTAVTYITAEGIRTPSVTQTSREEDKEQFELLQDALKIINGTDIYRYYLKSQERKGKKHIGFVIGKNFNYSHDITATDENDDEIGVDVYSMVSVCFKAIQEQQQQIKDLQQEIQNLKKESDR